MLTADVTELGAYDRAVSTARLRHVSLKIVVHDRPTGIVIDDGTPFRKNVMFSPCNFNVLQL